jgi:hypothetical protein
MFENLRGKGLRRGVAVVWIAGAGALIVSGCGSTDSSTKGDSLSEGSTPSGTTALTKAAFVKEASAICKEGSDKIQTEEKPFFQEHGIKSKTSATKKQGEEFISDVVGPSVQAQAEGVAELGAPKGDELEVEGIVGGIEKVAEAAEEAPASILVETPKGPLARVNEAAEAYGVDECKQP